MGKKLYGADDPALETGVRGTGDRPAAPVLPRPRAARLAVSTIFFVTGAAFATWAARVPAVQDRLDLSAGQLAVALVGLSSGAFLGLPLVGGLVARYGSRTVLCAGMAGYLAALAALAFVPGLAALTVVLALFACGNTAVDVAMNTQGVLVERAYGRPVLGGFHAMFSLGGIVGAGAGALVAWAGIGTGPHFAVTAVVLCAVAGVAVTALVPEPRRTAASGGGSGPLLALPGPGLWIPGLIAFCALMGEGVVNDWGAVYLHEVADAAVGAAGAGFAVFSAGMVIGRLTADRVRPRVGTTGFLLGCAVVAGAGALVPIVSPTVPAGLFGYGLLGLGLAAVVPVVFSHAADLRPDRPGPSIAAVSAVGYVGFLAGPPVIGFVAEATDLRVAMLVLPALMAVLAVLATRLRRA
ncbi:MULTISPECIES: MFS transporter [Streptomyces]|uniref:MFS transporter n=1 Tax=Streptomyces tsukubensis (strain DSM 42081 / NBRC 108919 / NRRL 18488 / 9993) TaxID=1114943 RepID=I2N2T4_STRT9|nr:MULTISPECIES: MFS transporter [Streptomyces]AZK95418.1 MFS transporter [Streptomyces tsukubensis]EIF91331.1 major facilitator superfamily protein [Streptomyces tsukubensis NRRL18488]MYS66811.1 MFS transporter [Streptomyces sp. SID5473]QKM68534.1 MFS transporter [Streptomyces tsukubensis NRRL18488]TAI43345.1 MFS transporter [Streptomyces tsukubensis]